MHFSEIGEIKFAFYNRNLKIEISADGTSYTKAMTTKKDTDIIVAVNTIYPLTFKSDAFSVSSTKSVNFTKGNLWWGKKGTESSATWHLEESQTAYPSSLSTSHVGHFFWTKTAENSYAESYSDGTCTTSDVPFFAESQGGLTVDGQSGLYALSKDEWTYLIESRTSGLYKYGVKVTNGGTSYTNCLIIAPDNYSGTALSQITDWSLSNINSLGLVCLPAAGYRSGSILNIGGSSGFYWSATPVGSSESYAYFLYFFGSGVIPSNFSSRDYGGSVRLVCSVSK